jgi:carbamate kinase
VPLDYCGADTQGAIGYIIQRSLNNQFRRDGIKKDVTTIVTQVLVDKNDEAFANPRKPIGSFMGKEEADRRVKNDKWNVIEDSGRGFRRVVASPIPVEIIEESSISTLVNHGTVVVAVGGGGIPVIRKDSGDLEGIAAVIDKDHASSLLASNLHADVLLISTAIEQVCLNFGKENQKNLATMTVAEAKQYLKEGHFAPGSMAPKIQACINFLENGGEKALITTPAAIPAALRGETGTWMVKE